MAENLGLDLKKPISVWNKPLKVNFKDLFKAVGKLGVDAATGKWEGVAKDTVETLAAVGLGSNTPEEQAWALIYNALAQAVASVVGDSRTLMRKLPENVEATIEVLDFSLEATELALSRDLFEYPERLAIVGAVRAPLRQFLEGMGVDEVQADSLSSRLPGYFAYALNREWRKNGSSYGEISTAIDTPFTKARERVQGWRLYRTWLQQKIQEPMLSEAFGLEDVYVPLRGYRREKRESDEEEFRRDASRGEYARVVVDIAEDLRRWLREANRNDAIRILSGGPGSGKSSFAKVFAAQHATSGAFPVLFVPLHQLRLSGDPMQAIVNFIDGDKDLQENPLDPGTAKLPRLLVIFDGLDELALQGKLAKEVAREFVREIRSIVKSDFNRESARLQVLFTGREVVVPDSFKDPRQVLHVLPYFVPEEKRKREDGEPYEDAENHLGCDQRNTWWSKYSAATKGTYRTMPAELHRENLTEITAQPLLNYLVALNFMQGKLTLSDKTNLNTVYADLLNAVYDRGYEDNKHAAIGDMGRKHFVRVLEEIALAAWHGDGRTTTMAEIERHCENSGLKRLLEVFEEGAKAGVTRLLAAFYFRQSGVQGNDRTFEFTHKSFGEYLTACRIVRAIERIQKQLDRREEDMEEGWDERQALLHWAEVCGPTRIDMYLLHFLRDQVALQDAERVGQWQRTFAHLIEVMLRQGMPMEKIEPQLRFQQANQWAIHAEEALLVVLSACASVTGKISEVNWPSLEIFGTWVKRLQGQRTGSSESVASLMSLDHLKLGRMTLLFQDLQKANLREADLRGVYLQQANLRGADLRGANLQGADLLEANLRGADLRGADLQQANLQKANLQRAELLGSELRGAYLWGAALQQADFRGTDLLGVSWDEETNWEDVRGLETAHNVPDKLKQQLGLPD